VFAVLSSDSLHLLKDLVALANDPNSKWELQLHFGVATLTAPIELVKGKPVKQATCDARGAQVARYAKRGRHTP